MPKTGLNGSSQTIPSTQSKTSSKPSNISSKARPPDSKRTLIKSKLKVAKKIMKVLDNNM